MAGENPSGLKETVELVGAFTKYGTILVGGLCLLLYSNEIGQFPEGLGLGEGLAFYLVSAGFLIVYAGYVATCTAMGAFVLSYPAQAFHRLSIQRESMKQKVVMRPLLHTDFSPMRDSSVVALGLLGILAHAAFIYFSYRPSHASLFLLVPLMQGAGVVFLLIVTRRQQHIQSGILLKEDSAQLVNDTRKNIAIARRVFVVWLAVAPMLLAPDRAFLVDAAFRMAQLRKDNATVHIKAPWTSRVGGTTLPKAGSFLGGDYQEIKGVTVLLRSVGAKVVIEMPMNSSVLRLSIPSDSIYVE